MLNKRHNSLITIAILLSVLGTGAIRNSETSAIAQSKPESKSFSLPESVPNGTKVKIAGSTSTAGIDRTFKEKFEAKFPNTLVDTKLQNSGAALEALTKGEVDLAAIGRPLTNSEKEQGLIAVPISREKIAIVVGKENNFQQNLTIEQFAKIFRGEITDWSELGGSPGKISVIDLSETNDTRQAFANYTVFQTGNFDTGSNAVSPAKDDIDAAIEKLGKNGIGYAVAGDVINRDDVRTLLLHQTQPDNPKYPFSQPFAFVYKDTPSPAAQAFLGFVTSPAGQQIIAARKTATPILISAGTVAATSGANLENNSAKQGESVVTKNPADATSKKTSASGGADVNKPNKATTGSNANGNGSLASDRASNSTDATFKKTSASGGADANDPNKATILNAAEAPVGTDVNSDKTFDNNGVGKTKVSFPWWIIPLVALIPLLGWLLLGRRSNPDNRVVSTTDDSLNPTITNPNATLDPTLDDRIPPIADARSTDTISRRGELETDNVLSAENITIANDGTIENMRESAQSLSDGAGDLGEGISNADNAALAGGAAAAGLWGNRTDESESVTLEPDREPEVDALDLEATAETRDPKVSEFENVTEELREPNLPQWETDNLSSESGDLGEGISNADNAALVGGAAAAGLWGNRTDESESVTLEPDREPEVDALDLEATAETRDPEVSEFENVTEELREPNLPQWETDNLSSESDDLGEGISNADNAALAGGAAAAGLWGNRTDESESVTLEPDREPEVDALDLEATAETRDPEVSELDLERFNTNNYAPTEDINNLDTDLELSLEDFDDNQYIGNLEDLDTVDSTDLELNLEDLDDNQYIGNLEDLDTVDTTDLELNLEEIDSNQYIGNLEDLDTVDTDLELNLETFEDIEDLDVDLADLDLETLDRDTRLDNLEDSITFDDKFDPNLENSEDRSISDLFDDVADEELDTSNNISEWLDNLDTTDSTSDNITEWLNNLDRNNGSSIDDGTAKLNRENSINNELPNFFDEPHEQLNESIGGVDDDSFQFLEDLLEQSRDSKKDDR